MVKLGEFSVAGHEFTQTHRIIAVSLLTVVLFWLLGTASVVFWIIGELLYNKAVK